MSEQSMSGQARNKRKRGDRNKLPLLSLIFLWVPALILAGGEFVYSIGAWDIATVHECKYLPSDLDVFMQDLTSGAALVFVVALYSALQYLQRGD